MGGSPATSPGQRIDDDAPLAKDGGEQMAEKRIQPKAADTEKPKSKAAAAGVQKKSLKKLSHKKTAKKVAKRYHGA
jgi:hypothetical protein